MMGSSPPGLNDVTTQLSGMPSLMVSSEPALDADTTSPACSGYLVYVEPWLITSRPIAFCGADPWLVVTGWRSAEVICVLEGMFVFRT